jgi:hypothetical protein
MTTAGPDRPLTAADLLFGSSADAPGALARHVMSVGRDLDQALRRLPRVTREAAVREAAAAAAVLLKVDLIEVLVDGWREHEDIRSAARRTLAMPGSKELVGLVPHRINTFQQPAVSILIDGRRVHTLQLGLSVFFEVTGLVAGVSGGRLAAVHSGRGEVGVALTVHEIEVLTKRAYLELPGVVALKSGFRLLPAYEYLGRGHHASHPGGPAYARSGAVGVAPPDSQFPGVDLLDRPAVAAGPRGVDLLDGGAVAAGPPGVDPLDGGASAAVPPGAGHADAEHAGSPPSGLTHPSSGQTGHPSLPWWEKTQALPGPSGSPAP